MPFTSLPETLTADLLAPGVVALYAVAALLAVVLRGPALRWRIAQAGAAVAGALAVLALWLVLFQSGPAASAPLLPFVRADRLGATMLLLVTFLGWVVLRYSARYLAGDPAERRGLPGLLAALACVTVVLTANHLLLLAAAWFGASVALHRLLTLYPARPAALIAAHKKFLVSRLADLALLGALWLTYSALGTWRLDEIGARLAAMPGLPPALEVAATLFVLAALLKCAQLPFHGWLIQVMEAPTPVSALLHAGIVNLGGFVLIRLAELIGLAHAAQALLVVAGGATAVLATLVASTRISVKVALAWSTCAQMGFMLMQIGLGLYALALLHLIAHSLYKAHAFLSAGGAVEQARIRSLLPQPGTTAVAELLPAAMAGVGIVLLGHALWPAHAAATPALWVVTLIAGLALTPLFAPRRGARPVAHGRAMLGGVLTAAAYVSLHELAAPLAGLPVARVAPVLLPSLVAAAFLALFLLQHWLAAHPAGRLATTLHPWFYAGFHLDELFTRLTFRIWPARLPRPRTTRLLRPVTAEGDSR